MANAASATASNDAIHGLDLLRQRLSQMSTSIASLKADLERNEPLPSWSSLQSSAQILSHNLSQLMATFDAHRDYLAASHAYPLPTFPGHTQEELLNQLLRKRLEPRTEEWLKKYETAQQFTNGTRPTQTKHELSHGKPDLGQLRELWNSAGPRSNAIVKSMVEAGSFDDDFTLEEQERGIETVNTGLQRNLVDSEGNDAEEDADADADADIANGSQGVKERKEEISATIEKAPMPIGDILRFVSTGGGSRPT